MDKKPLVTIGIPVFNGEATIEATARSVLAQTHRDLVLLIVDNASTDATQAICEALARSDPRVRYVRNEANIGQNANFNKVRQLSTGTFHRWIGDDDWLEPTYVEECVQALLRVPDASLVSTYQAHVKPDGTELYDEYQGPRPMSSDPIKRLNIMLQLLTGSPLWIDPVYCMMRASHLPGPAPIRPVRFGDEILACELALEGSFLHIPQKLAYRSWAPLPKGRQATARYAGGSTTGVRAYVTAGSQRLIMLRTVAGLVLRKRDLSLPQRVQGIVAIGRFGIKKAVLRVWRYVVKRVPRV